MAKQATNKRLYTGCYQYTDTQGTGFIIYKASCGWVAYECDREEDANNDTSLCEVFESMKAVKKYIESYN